MIEVHKLSKTFHAARPLAASLRRPWQQDEPIRALHEISLTIEQGRVCCLMGPNGAGKTTLLKILAGLISPTHGMAAINGHDISRHTPEVKAAIGYAPGEPHGFYDRLTGRQNLKFFAALYSLSAAQTTRRIDELSEALGVAALDRRYQEYSAGMKQRLVLARALLHDPPVLLLDEPTRSLDPAQADRILELLRRLRSRQRKTILLITHRRSEAERLADVVALLDRGALRSRDTATDIGEWLSQPSAG